MLNYVDSMKRIVGANLQVSNVLHACAIEVVWDCVSTKSIYRQAYCHHWDGCRPSCLSFSPSHPPSRLPFLTARNRLVSFHCLSPLIHCYLLWARVNALSCLVAFVNTFNGLYHRAGYLAVKSVPPRWRIAVLVTGVLAFPDDVDISSASLIVISWPSWEISFWFKKMLANTTVVSLVKFEALNALLNTFHLAEFRFFFA